MKRFGIAFILFLVCFPAVLSAQYKHQPTIKEALSSPASGLVLGFLDPEKFSMNHSFSASFVTFGGNSMMVNSYVNTINYQFSAPLSLRLNLGLMNTPYSSFNTQPGLSNALDLNSTRLFGGAELMYRPSENTAVTLGVDVRPGYNYYYQPYRLKK